MTFGDSVKDIKADLHRQANNFSAGQIRYCLPEWEKITIDEDILKMVEGVDIQFTDLPVQEHQACNHQFSQEQTEAIDLEISELLKKGVIKKTPHSAYEYVSPIFVVPKKDNKWRMILNLKSLNKDVEYHHFKMETMRNALDLVRKDCFFCSLDLKDAYFSVHVMETSQKFLKFSWRGQLYAFTAFPNGLACCPRLFTKLLKPVMAHLHMLGFVSTIFIDDTLLIGDSEVECEQNMKHSLALFQKLGFVVHPEKSVLEPSQKIKYLGFVIDSQHMTVTPTLERKQKILERCSRLMEEGFSTIRELAQLIGQVVASFQGVKFGPLWYRNMEYDKVNALKQNKGNYDAVVFFSEEAKVEMKWWCDNIMACYNDVDADRGDPDLVIYTDASLTGWGCSSEIGRTGGHWDSVEAQNSINVLELKAALLALQSLVKDKSNLHIRLMMDNTTAVACVSKMGTSHSVACNLVTQDIWKFCIQHNLWLSAAYVPGKLNVEADEESRKENKDAEWRLNNDILLNALRVLQAQPEIDLFASRLNYQFSRYVSYRPDPYAVAVNAFTLSWTNLNFYIFCPFSVISRVLSKIAKDRAKGILVVPDWPSQPWYPQLAKLLIKPPVLVSARVNLLSLPEKPEEKHRLCKSLRLIICEVSGVDSDSQVFRSKLPLLSVLHGGVAHRDNMPHTSLDGRGMRVRDRYIRFHRL